MSKANNHLNYLALQQNILGKPLRIGSGPEEGTETELYITKTGFKVYLNGTHSTPNHNQIESHLLIGYMKHPHAMEGMPGSSGELEYYLCFTEHEFIAILSLKLDEETNGKSDAATDWVAIIKREDLPEGIEDNSDNYYEIAEALLEAHLNAMFEFYESEEDLNEWEFGDDALRSMVMGRYDPPSE
jgi:hypothetical protein